MKCKKKKLVGNPGGGITAITKETASGMHARSIQVRREKLRAAANFDFPQTGISLEQKIREHNAQDKGLRGGNRDIANTAISAII